MKLSLPSQRILDFDCECRPLSWYGGDFVTKEITAIAWSWHDKPQVTCVVLDLDNRVDDFIELFVDAYNKADIVTGHYIRGFDLPLINAALIEYGLKPLGDKLTQDTKLDLVKRGGMSNSQENLGSMFELAHPKIPMDQAKWREANRLTPLGVALTKKRCIGDVRQHKELRQRMIDLDLLRPPVRWSGKASGRGKYNP